MAIRHKCTSSGTCKQPNAGDSTHCMQWKMPAATTVPHYKRNYCARSVSCMNTANGKPEWVCDPDIEIAMAPPSHCIRSTTCSGYQPILSIISDIPLGRIAVFSEQGLLLHDLFVSTLFIWLHTTSCLHEGSQWQQQQQDQQQQQHNRGRRAPILPSGRHAASSSNSSSHYRKSCTVLSARFWRCRGPNSVCGGMGVAAHHLP